MTMRADDGGLNPPPDDQTVSYKVGDRVYYRAHSGAVDRGTVIQVEGGKDGDLTEVFWPRVDQALWIPTNQLWAEEPPQLEQECVCGCPFGEHSVSGCIPHQLHRFVAAG